MVMGILVLPVSRNSIWSVVFGLSWEGMIVYHQWVGYLFLLLIVAHGLCWWGVYYEEGTFPHDIFAIPQEYHSVLL